MSPGDLPTFRGREDEEETLLRRLRSEATCPGWVAQLVRTLSLYTKIVGSILGQDTYKKQPMNA